MLNIEPEKKAESEKKAICCDNPNEKIVSLTFDATYVDDQTLKLLDILDRNNIKATFFCSGIWLEKFHQLAKDIAAAGHEIGNHGYTHPHMTQIPISEVRDQIIKTEELIKSTTGKTARYFRPPFGEYNQEILDVASELGYQTILWTINSLDWKNPGVHSIINRVTANIKPRAIVLMHQDAGQTPKALPAIINYLKSQGYSFGTVSQVIGSKY
jgi:polysaccharide deacetylase family sporulation protein PdaB